MKRAPRHPAVIQRNTPTKDARGQFIDTWTTLASVMLDLHQMTGRELEAAMQTRSEATWRAFMRYAPGLTIRTDDRVTCQGQTLDIVSAIDVDNAHQWIQLDLKVTT